MTRLPAASQIHLVRLPNILSIQPLPYDPRDPEALQHELDAQLSEGSVEPVGRLLTENVIRWRGDVEAIDSATWRESNSRLVRWSDGSMTLHLGTEVLVATPQQLDDASTQVSDVLLALSLPSFY